MISSKPKRRPDVVVKEIGHETILYRNTQEGIHILNPTAKLVWDLCDGEHSPEAIEQALRATFAILPEHAVSEDIQRILGVFASKNLLADVS